MLVLSRKIKEQILIGDDVRITLLRIDGNKVRIGIDAPKHIRVIRGELTPTENDAEGDESRGQISEREEAFAHPTDEIAREARPKQICETGLSFALSPQPVRKPRRAPLADFMTAG